MRFIGDFEPVSHQKPVSRQMRHPVTHWRPIRTTNLLERLFVAEFSRLKTIPDPFGERVPLVADVGRPSRLRQNGR
jgi:hypothetical protein